MRGFRPRAHGNVSLRFCIVYCSQGNREQPAHYLKQYKNAGKCFRVHGAQMTHQVNLVSIHIQQSRTNVFSELCWQYLTAACQKTDV